MIRITNEPWMCHKLGIHIYADNENKKAVIEYVEYNPTTIQQPAITITETEARNKHPAWVGRVSKRIRSLFRRQSRLE